MFELMIKEHFDAAHSLRGYNGKCANIHGHTWEVEVSIIGNKLDSIGMVIDFSDLKKAVKEKMNIFDHKYINELNEFNEASGVNPTAENIAYYLFHTLRDDLEISNHNVKLKEVKVWESQRSCASYRED